MDLPIKPMLAKSAPAPRDAEDFWPAPFGRDGYSFEPKLDGYRAVVLLRPGVKPLMWSRPGRMIGSEFPELHEHLMDVVRPVVLDGEVVMRNGDGAFDFESLISRGMLSREERAAGLTFAAFDLLEVGGQEVWRQPLMDRRRMLEEETDLLSPEHFHLVPSRSDGEALWREVVEAKGEGIITKPLSAGYRFGERGTWTKFKLTQTATFRIVGYVPGIGARAGGIGSLYLARIGGTGYQFAGVVGTGFDGPTTDRLLKEFREIQAAAPPFEGPELKAAMRGLDPTIVWLEPTLDGQVEFQEYMAGGAMRFPSFKGLVG